MLEFNCDVVLDSPEVWVEVEYEGGMISTDQAKNIHWNMVDYYRILSDEEVSQQE